MDPFSKPTEGLRPKFFQSANGDLVEVTDGIIDACYTVKCLINARGRMVFKNSLGGVFVFENDQVIHQKEQKLMATLLQNDAERLIVFVHDVRTNILRKLLDFISFHQTDVTERERKAWNATYIEQCSQILCELASAAYYLDHKPLVNLTSRAIASQISGKTTEELREVLGTQNEPPLPASMTNHLPARFRLQAKVDSKKQKEKLALLNGTAPPAIEAAPKSSSEPDNRSVEDILAFLGEDSKSSNGKKAKGKKGKAAKEISKDSSSKQDGKPVASPAAKSASTASDSSKSPSKDISATAEPITAPSTSQSAKPQISSPIDARSTSSFPSTQAAATPTVNVLPASGDDVRASGSIAMNGKPKTLNISASSSSSASSSTSSSSANTRASVACDDCAQDVCECPLPHEQAEVAPVVSNILSGSMLTHLTFPSPFSAPTPAAAPQMGSPALPPGLHSFMMQEHASRFAASPTPPVTYQPLANFLPDPFAAPPGLDLPPGLPLPQHSPIRSPSYNAINPVTGLQTSAELASSTSRLGLGLSDPFVMETSSFTLPPLTDSSSSAQYYWGAPGDDDILKTSQDGLDEDPDFENELAEFRQSLELGLRSSNNSFPRNLHSSGNHSSQSGNKPVGAY